MSYTIPQMASFFDGEGCFAITKLNQGYAGKIEIGHTFLPVLHHFRDTFGGSVRVGANHGKQSYVWNLYGSALIPCLEALIPHLWEKKPQAELLLEFCWKYRTNPRIKGRIKCEKLEQEWYYRRLQELKQDQTTMEESSRPEEFATQLRLVV